jgi:hypothetical protein
MLVQSWKLTAFEGLEVSAQEQQQMPMLQVGGISSGSKPVSSQPLSAAYFSSTTQRENLISQRCH